MEYLCRLERKSFSDIDGIVDLVEHTYNLQAE
jgi:hypothetical protein